MQTDGQLCGVDDSVNVARVLGFWLYELLYSFPSILLGFMHQTALLRITYLLILCKTALYTVSVIFTLTFYCSSVCVQGSVINFPLLYSDEYVSDATPTQAAGAVIVGFAASLAFSFNGLVFSIDGHEKGRQHSQRLLSSSDQPPR